MNDKESIKPQISENSKRLASPIRSQKGEDFYRNLSQSRKATDDKLRELREKREEEIMKECSFRPQLKVSRSSSTHIPK